MTSRQNTSGEPNSRAGADTTRTEPRTLEDVILEIRDTSVTFDMSRGESRVLNGVNLDIEREEIVGVVGESGSGKSMFASSLLDAVVPPGQLSGSITYHPEDGEPVDILDFSDRELRRFRWEHISFVFQGAMSSFNPTMKIREHFVETCKAHDRNVKEGLNHARDLLGDLYLDADRVLDSYPHELSGGMKQRALIALSLVLDPEILVMDEPTAALDLLMQRSILNLLQNIQKKYNLTVVFITHDLPLVAGLADKLVVMYAFEFIEMGATDDVMLDASHPYTRSLLKAVPNLDTPLEEMRPIDGSSPDPVDVPSGCSYHPRCPIAKNDCVSDDPDLRSTDEESHQAACFYWDEAKEEIEYQLEVEQ